MPSTRFPRSVLLLTAFSFVVFAPHALQGQQQTQPMAQRQPVGPSGDQRRIPLVTAEQAVQNGQAKVAAPPWQLTREEQQYVDQVLAVWEKSTDQIKRYKCDVKRWQFDRESYEHGHYAESIGSIRFQKPGKGEFKIDQVKKVLSRTQQPAQYAVNPGEPMGEHWICDGEWVHILDQKNKTATRTQMPPAYRGQMIYQSPLPFLFGVKAAEVKQRYWVRGIPTPQRPDELWLEVVPKRADDRGNYSRVQVIIDRKDILPKGLIVFMPGWTSQREDREVYEFSNREMNKVMDALRANVFNQRFIPTKLGADWTVDEHPYIPQQMANPQGRVATPPAIQPQRR